MADPLGPSILSALFLLFSAFVCALNDALPSMDASELNKKAEQDASAQRMLRLLNRYDNGFGEIRMTYAALIAASFASLAAAVCPRVCAALHVSAALCALICVYCDGSSAEHPQSISRRRAMTARAKRFMPRPLTSRRRCGGSLRRAPDALPAK